MKLRPFRNRQAGVGMIEILIAVLVLSIGLLGLAALQGFSLQSNQTAYERTQATNLAYELLDYMRANHGVVCADGGLPAADYTAWATRAAATLPSADVDSQNDVVDVNTATCDTTITIAWTERDIDDDDPDNETVDLSFALTTQL